jgi:acetylornithine aminotransferase
LAAFSVLSVLEVLETEQLMEQVLVSSEYFKEKARAILKVKKVKGRGLMLGLEFDFPVSELRKNLIYKHHIFTGSAKNPNLLRILPPLTVQKEHLDVFFEALRKEL